jgi:hypothetical protein
MPKLGVPFGIVLAMAVGCGGGSSGFNPGVPGSKPVGQLSGDEAKTLCDNTVAHYRMTLTSSTGRESTCRAAGAVVASLQSTATATDLQIQFTCIAGYTLCEQAIADGGLDALSGVGGGDGGADPCAGAANPDPTCTATVAQYTACINESEAALMKAYPSCAELTKAKLTELTSAPGGILGAGTNGPACTAFSAACPGFNIRPGLPVAPAP